MTRLPLYLSIALLGVSTAAYGPLYTARAHGLFLYAVDDAYIGFATAKALAEHGVWGATRYESAAHRHHSSGRCWSRVFNAPSDCARSRR